ncbi:MAG: transposase [Erysipelotrichaceae bacterium]|nr:transposase [Erysipelotrichaceae bacterium]
MVYRWFLGLDFTESVPHFSSLGCFRCVASTIDLKCCISFRL